MTVAVVSDAIRHRFVFTLIPITIALAGFTILLRVHDNVHLEYAALFLAASGTYSAMPIIVCWFNTNRELEMLFLRHRGALTPFLVAGHRRRAVATGWQVGFGNSKYEIAVSSLASI